MRKTSSITAASSHLMKLPVFILVFSLVSFVLDAGMHPRWKALPKPEQSSGIGAFVVAGFHHVFV